MKRWAWLLCGCLGCQSWMSGGAASVAPPSVGVVSPAEQGSPPAPATEAGASTVVRHQTECVFPDMAGEAVPVHLAGYAQHPERTATRLEWAESLCRQKYWGEARRQLEKVIVEAQEHEDEACRVLLRSHARLMEIAREEEDSYQGHLQRGIGLYLIACHPEEGLETPHCPTAETLLYRAVAELQAARDEIPQAARPHFYLYCVWSRLDETSAADKSLLAADQNVVSADLTPKERRELQICLARARMLHADPQRIAIPPAEVLK